MDQHLFTQICRMNAALVRVEAMKVEVAVAVAKGDNYPPDYSNDMRHEAELIDSLWRG